MNENENTNTNENDINNNSLISLGLRNPKFLEVLAKDLKLNDLSNVIDVENIDDTNNQNNVDNLGCSQLKKNPTILNVLNNVVCDIVPDLEKDADEIYNYLVKFDYKYNKTEAQKFIDLLLTRSSFQLKKINYIYDQKYTKSQDKNIINKTLMEFIKKKTVGDFSDAMKYLFSSPVELDVFLINSCFGFSTSDDKLARLITWKDPWTLKEIKHCYYATYGISLEEKIASKVDKNVKDFYSLIFQCDRDVNKKAFLKQCKKDVDNIIKAGPDFWDMKKGISELFKTIFFKRSFADLKEIIREYEKKVGHGININLDQFNAKQKTFLEQMLFVNRKTHYLSKLVRSAVEGSGTNEELLNEGLIGLRNAQLMENALLIYSKEFGTTMEQDIIDDTSDDEYRGLLLSIVKQGKEARLKHENL